MRIVVHVQVQHQNHRSAGNRIPRAIWLTRPVITHPHIHTHTTCRNKWKTKYNEMERKMQMQSQNYPLSLVPFMANHTISMLPPSTR